MINQRFAGLRAFGKVLIAIYLAAVIGLVAYVLTIDSGSPIGWVVAWCVASALLIFAPVFPWVGLAVYVFLAYATPRYGGGVDTLISSHVLDAVALLALFALFFRGNRVNEIVFGLRASLTMLMLALALWILIAAMAAQLRGVPWQPYTKHTPLLFAHGLAMFLVARHALEDNAAAWQFALVACLGLSVRALTQGSEGVYLEGDVAPLIVMLVPLAVMGVRIVPAVPLKVLFAIFGTYLGFTLLFTQNRAAALAAAAAVVSAGWQSRHRWVFALGIPLLLIVMVIFAPKGYQDRFRALWDSQARHSTAELDRATAAERIELWKAGWAMAVANPLVGVGPGNYPHVVGLHAPSKQGLAAHSNYVHMLAETGFPGLFLYVLLFTSTLLALGRVRLSSYSSNRSTVAAMLQLSLIAYLVAGVFISRHDLVLAYLLAGWAGALSSRLPASPHRTQNPQAQVPQ